VGTLVSYAAHQVMKQAQARGVQIKTMAKTEAVTILDGLLVSRVVDNLLGNAITYSPRGSQIALEYGTEKEMVVISVSDHGPAISEGARERQFPPVLSERRQRPPEVDFHAGLGLTFCKAVIRAHEGELTHENHPTRGVTFTVRLPWVRPTRLSMVPR
jgi:K+-sensing histidine kinase KdpD